MKKTLLALSLTASAFLTGCGGGGDAGFYWDGFFSGGLQWRCRDSSNGQFVNNWMCADQKVGDRKWPTDGIPLETNLWLQGVSISKICESSINKFVMSRTGQYTWKTYGDIQPILRNQGISANIDYSQFWNQSDSAALSILYKFDEKNWALFTIRAKSRTDFYPAWCQTFLMEEGIYKGAMSL